MNREPRIGECVCVVRDSRDSNITPGTRMIVSAVDTADDTLRGFATGSKKVSDWVPWSDVEPVRFGWDFVRSNVPPDVAALLSGCDGAKGLGLNPQVKLAIVSSLPNLKDRILEAVQAIDADDEGGEDDDDFEDD